ncbi:flagellar basal body-associated FliL family protein [Mesobaculum littorinae]|uniref:Flagellar protein FliL n=1 Tax=Mesobaculum littorinae TaxID=2486419 RepID=A0A438AGY3_9RHOB|nr:flagellar basal body-associated FliL family protein [Mesobaculum littorinae]RVV97973.1 flagellar basal body-associated FliL family protein [Mesobaculum littorinae]
MAEDDQTPGDDGAPAPAKKSKLGLLIGLVLALLLGGGGFYAVWSGLILGPPAAEGGEEIAELPPTEALPPLRFVELDPIMVSLGPASSADHLRFQAQLEVDPPQEEAVRTVMPRIIDVLNGYLRAVEPAELEDPAALTRLRAQMLRRVQIVAGEGRVRDLLIIQFVLS